MHESIEAGREYVAAYVEFMHYVEGFHNLVSGGAIVHRATESIRQEHVQDQLNDRQKKALNHMLDAGPGGFEGGLTTRKYVGMNKVSRATAFREISDMIEKKILRQLPGKERSVRYDLVWPKASS